MCPLCQNVAPIVQPKIDNSQPKKIPTTKYRQLGLSRTCFGKCFLCNKMEQKKYREPITENFVPFVPKRCALCATKNQNLPITKSPTLKISQSPHLPISQSPHLPITPSHCATKNHNRKPITKKKALDFTRRPFTFSTLNES